MHRPSLRIKLGKNRLCGPVFVLDSKQTHLRVHILVIIPRSVTHTDVSLFGN